jgi:hypothetical protein
LDIFGYAGAHQLVQNNVAAAALALAAIRPNVARWQPHYGLCLAVAASLHPFGQLLVGMADLVLVN